MTLKDHKGTQYRILFKCWIVIRPGFLRLAQTFHGPSYAFYSLNHRRKRSIDGAGTDDVCEFWANVPSIVCFQANSFLDGSCFFVITSFFELNEEENWLSMSHMTSSCSNIAGMIRHLSDLPVALQSWNASFRMFSCLNKWRQYCSSWHQMTYINERHRQMLDCIAVSNLFR